MHQIFSKKNLIESVNHIILSDDIAEQHDYLNNLKNNFYETKSNIFPDKYMYKHEWLMNGYKTTYKKDFIKQKKTRNSNSLHTSSKEEKNNLIEPKHNLVGKIYPMKNNYYVNSIYNEDWNNPYKY